MAIREVGRVTFDGRYVIIQVSDDWEPGDPLPPPSVHDRWFTTFLDFVSALRRPYDRTPIEREAWSPLAEEGVDFPDSIFEDDPAPEHVH